MATQHQHPQSRWSGSAKTASAIRAQIAERWGEEEAEKYDPETNCFTFNTWRAKGYKVKRGEKALRSYTFVEERDTDGDVMDGNATRYPKNVCLFYILQVEKRSPEQEANQ